MLVGVNLHEVWPLGKLLRPSVKKLLLPWQITPPVTWSYNCVKHATEAPCQFKLRIRIRSAEPSTHKRVRKYTCFPSGKHRQKKSDLGLPIAVLIISVKTAVMSSTAKRTPAEFICKRIYSGIGHSTFHNSARRII